MPGLTLKPPKAAVRSARLPLWRSLLLLIVAGFGGLALLMRPGESDVGELPAALVAEPDLTLEDSVITEYGADGTPKYRLAAHRLSQFETPRHGNRVAELERPRFVLYDRAASPWHVQGDEGELHRGAVGNDGSAERAELRGNVVLAQRRGASRAEVRTAALTVYPAERRARSTQPVVVVAAIGQAAAAGFEADLRSGTMTLLSSGSQRVSIVLDPPPAMPASR